MLKKTDITILLDRSGSMSGIAEATVAGINRFISEQEQEPGEGVWTLVTFDDAGSAAGAGEDFPKVVWNAVDQREHPRLQMADYQPRNSTALIDAACKTIDQTGLRLASLAEADRPDGVMVVIVTDGLDNHSRQYKKDDLAQRITHQQSKYNWQFLFLGANIDAFQTGADYGIPKVSTANFAATPAGTSRMYGCVSRGASNWKKGKAVNLTEEEAKTEPATS